MSVLSPSSELLQQQLLSDHKLCNQESTSSPNQREPEPVWVEEEEPEPGRVKEEEPEPGWVKEEQPEPGQVKEEEPEPGGIKEEEPEPGGIKEEEPEPVQIKEEPSEFCVGREGEQLSLSQETATLMFQQKPKSEEAFGVSEVDDVHMEETDGHLLETQRSSHTAEMDRCERWVNAKEACLLFQDLSDGESEGGEVVVDVAEDDSVEGESDDPSFLPGIESSTEDEELMTARRPRKRPRLLVTSEQPPLTHTQPPGAHSPTVTEPPQPATETSKDGTVWTTIQPGLRTGKVQSQDVPTERGGPTLYARCNIGDPMSAFMCLMDAGILQHICDCSVAEARRRGAATWELDLAELKAFIALLLARGVHCGMQLEDLWSNEWGPPFFTTTMPRNRFKEIMRYLRFDRKDTRRVRLLQDRFAMVSEVWDRLVQNSQAAYKPGADITVAEQLFPTKSRCPFTQYMPNKPGKFGIKFWVAADVETKYMLNAYPYLGKDPGHPATQSLAESVVLRLMEPFMGKGRNVTTDNFFTSVPLASKLLARNTSLVGAITKTKRSLPPSAHLNAGLYETRLLQSDGATLTIYQGTERKHVCILSTMHTSVDIHDNSKRTPETVHYYNKTKVGVDALDQMLRQYSTRAGTRRWPVAMFYNILDMAALNAWVLYRSCTGASVPRRGFILELCKLLRNQHMSRPAKTPATLAQENRRRICGVKRKCKKNKAAKRCTKCQRAVCGQCTVHVYSVCADCE